MRLKRNNVEREAGSKEVAEKLKKEGFEEVSVKTESIDIGRLKVGELRILAKQKGIEGYEKMKKEELLELLKGKEEKVGEESEEEP